MREPPKLDNAVLQETLRTAYGLSSQRVTFLPLGNDLATFVYEVIGHDHAHDPDEARYFLKLRTRAGFSAPSISVPRFLSECGVPNIVTPIATTGQTLWVDLDDFVLTLYPFIETRTAAEAGLSDKQWVTLGATLKQIHLCPLPTALQQQVPREPFIPSRRAVLTQLETVVTQHQNDLTDPAQVALWAFWHTHHDDIQNLIDHADALGHQLRHAALSSVLCHADIHTWNILLDTTQHMWIVDWDETILAPKERDLMFMMGGIARNLVSPHQTACFLQGYGEMTLNPQALAYYRYAWAVQEMGAYAEEVFFMPGRSDRARADALEAFIGIFAEGNIAAIACTSLSANLR